MNHRLNNINNHFSNTRMPLFTLKTFLPFDFQSVGNLKDKTIFITGASRGIGLDIALRCAKDGANIVIVAKTIEVNPKLPGTIYTAAKEIEAAGGNGGMVRAGYHKASGLPVAIKVSLKIRFIQIINLFDKDKRH